MDKLGELKLLLREESCPFFSDEELAYHLRDSGDDVKKAAYKCCLIKAEDTTLSVSGLNCADTSKYFLRLAQTYRKSNSGTLKGG